MKSLTLSRIAVAWSCVAAISASAQVPSKLGYQGRLLKADGTAETGVVSFKFSLFSAATGGTELWTETQMLGLTDGYYSTFLGEVTPVPVAVFDGTERFLELRINATPLAPRQRLNSVAYALRASQTRDVAGGGTVDTSSVSIGGTTVINGTGQIVPAALGPLGTVGTAGTINDAANPIEWTKIKSVPLGFADGTDDGITSITPGPGISVTPSNTSPTVGVIFGSDAGMVAQGNDPRFSDPRLPLPGSNLYIANGSTLQNAGFNIGGNARIGGLTTLQAAVGPSRIEMRGGIDGTTSSSMYLYRPNGELGVVISDGTYPTFFGGNDGGGNVGIGTTTPLTKLDVNGAIRATGNGGNVPHACVQRSVTFAGAAGVASCAVGEIVVGGGGSCDVSTLRGSRPSGGSWLIDCAVAGTASIATAICCQY